MRKVLLSAFVAVVMACGGDDGPSGPEDLPECSGPVTVTATTGPTPTFSWAPRCRLFLLIVEPAEGGDQWLILTRSENALAPPVTYGDVPASAEETSPPVSLEAGMAYKVGVFRWTGPGYDDGELIGVQTFTPAADWPAGDPPFVVKYTVSVTDPINDRVGADFPIDVSKMDLTLDPGTGDYEIVLRTHTGFPFIGAFRININLFNVDAGSFFSDALNDFDLTSPTDSILLIGRAGELTTWQIGDQVYTNSLAGTPNPPGVSLFRSAVGIDGGFSEDVIAFADLAQPATVAMAVVRPEDQVSHILDELEGLIASGALQARESLRLVSP